MATQLANNEKAKVAFCQFTTCEGFLLYRHGSRVQME
jgi:hypothetical protein